MQDSDRILVRVMSQDNKLDKIDTKLDGLVAKTTEIEKHLAVYNKELERHIEGTVQNREAIKLLDKKLSPIQSHVDRIDGALKLIGIVSILVGIAVGIANLLS